MSRPASPPAAKFVALIFGLAIVYLTLVVANLVLVEAGRSFNAAAGDPDVLAAIKARKTEEDPPQIEAAKAKGLAPLIYPDMVSKPGAFEEFIAHAEASRRPPIGSHLATETYYCNEGYGLVSYTSDRFGLRNPDALWDWTGLTVAIGDSFVHGACVADDETIPAAMGTAGERALNLATASNNPLHYAFLARLFAPALKPKRLILFFYANDNLAKARREDTAASVFGDMLRQEEDLSGFLARDDAGRLQPSESYKAAMARYRAFTDARLEEGRGKWSFWDKVFKRDYWTIRHARTMLAGLVGADDGLDPLSQMALAELKRQCDAVGCAPLVVWIPNSEKAAPDGRAPAYRDALRREATAFGLPFLDLASALAPLGDTAFAPKGLHLSPAGYAAVGKAVAATR